MEPAKHPGKKRALTPPRGRTTPTKDPDYPEFAALVESAKSVHTLAFSKMTTWQPGCQTPHPKTAELYFAFHHSPFFLTNVNVTERTRSGPLYVFAPTHAISYWSFCVYKCIKAEWLDCILTIFACSIFWAAVPFLYCACLFKQVSHDKQLYICTPNMRLIHFSEFDILFNTGTVMHGIATAPDVS